LIDALTLEHNPLELFFFHLEFKILRKIVAQFLARMLLTRLYRKLKNRSRFKKMISLSSIIDYLQNEVKKQLNNHINVKRFLRKSGISIIGLKTSVSSSESEHML
jgi:hypothetical protein